MNTVADQIEKETGGELTVRLHLGGSLPINTTTITQAVSDDVVQMGDDGYFLGNVPIGGVLRLPMLIRTPEEYQKAAAIMTPYLEEAFAEERCARAGAVPAHPFQVAFSSKKLTALTDIKGQKIRVTSPEQGEFIKRLGGIPVTLRCARGAIGARPRCRGRRPHSQHRRRQRLEGSSEVQLSGGRELFQLGHHREQGAF